MDDTKTVDTLLFTYSEYLKEVRLNYLLHNINYEDHPFTFSSVKMNGQTSHCVSANAPITGVVCLYCVTSECLFKRQLQTKDNKF